MDLIRTTETDLEITHDFVAAPDGVYMLDDHHDGEYVTWRTHKDWLNTYGYDELSIDRVAMYGGRYTFTRRLPVTRMTSITVALAYYVESSDIDDDYEDDGIAYYIDAEYTDTFLNGSDKELLALIPTEAKTIPDKE